MKTQDLARAVQEHAQSRYDKWSVLIECYSLEDIQDSIKNCTTLKGALSILWKEIKGQTETMQSEIAAHHYKEESFEDFKDMVEDAMTANIDIVAGPDFEAWDEDGPYTKHCHFLVRTNKDGVRETFNPGFDSKYEAEENRLRAARAPKSEWEEGHPWSAYEENYEEEGRWYTSQGRRIF